MLFDTAVNGVPVLFHISCGPPDLPVTSPKEKDSHQLKNRATWFQDRLDRSLLYLKWCTVGEIHAAIRYQLVVFFTVLYNLWFFFLSCGNTGQAVQTAPTVLEDIARLFYSIRSNLDINQDLIKKSIVKQGARVNMLLNFHENTADYSIPSVEGTPNWLLFELFMSYYHWDLLFRSM